MAHNESTDEGPRPAASLVRALSFRYLIALVMMAALVVLDQAIIQPLLVGLNVYAPRINLAGRQRMLSQKVSKEALVLALLPDETGTAARRQQLVEAVQQWKTVHRSLCEQSTHTRRAHAPSPVRAALHELDDSLTAVTAAATAIATGNVSAAEQSRQLHAMLAHEAKFLAGMEQVVYVLERAAQREVFWLRLCELAVMGTLLALLGGIYFVVLAPATSLIREQVGQLSTSEYEHRQLCGLLARARDELEDRVAQRTSELRRANASLSREIAERCTFETRIRGLAAQLAQASRITSLGQLATGLAHEINQPLASIVSYSDTAELLLERDPVDLGPARQAIVQVKHAALRAGAIVRRMRNFVRRGTVSPTRVDLNDLVREVCELCRPQLEQSGVHFSLEAADGSIEIEADAIEIQQVLVNVVQNAIQALVACPSEGRTLCLRTVAEAAEARVEVVDSGPGFTARVAEDVFAPFYSTKADGLGMGLAISRTILERYQGRLTAANRPAGGARVVICLPLMFPDKVESDASTHCLCC